MSSNTDPTSTASSGEPSTALAAEPVARTGVSGSDSSVRTARVKSTAEPTGRVPTRRTTRTARVRVRTRQPESSAGKNNSSGDGAGRSAHTSATDSACQSWAERGGGSGAASAVRAADVPAHSPAAAPAVTDSGPVPGTPGNMSSAPRAEASRAISTPRRLAVRAAGSACRIRHAPVRSRTIRSAGQGGRLPSRRTPMPTSARARACAASAVRTTTVPPPRCNLSTMPSSAASIDSTRGSRRSNPFRREPAPSSSTETTTIPARRAAASTADA
ncbi:hypothetical protein ACYAFX_15210 [Rhodococcus aetherivorans]